MKYNEIRTLMGQSDCSPKLLSLDYSQYSQKERNHLLRLSVKYANLDLFSRIEASGVDPEAAIRAFREAVVSGYTQAIGMLKAASVNLDAPFNEEGVTGLMLASEKGDLAMVSALLSSGANPDLSTPVGRTALMLAAKHKQPKILKALIDAGANVNIGDTRKRTALIYAIQKDNRDCIQVLLQKNANIHVMPSDKRTALIMALELEDVSLVKEILALGAKPNQRSDGHISPLETALNRGNVECVEILLSAGAVLLSSQYGGELSWSVLGNNSEGCLPLILEAAKNPDMVLSRYAYRQDATRAFEHALNKGDKLSSEHLLAADAPLGVKGLASAIQHKGTLGKDLILALIHQAKKHDDYFLKADNPAVKACVVQNDLESLKCMVNLGAKLEQTHMEASHFLVSLATEHSSEAMLDYLLECGLSVNQRDGKCYTALDMAARRGDENAVRWLVSKGALIDGCPVLQVPHTSYRVPLILAAEFKHADVVRCLIELGADPKRRGFDRYDSIMTPLVVAGFLGYTDIVSILVASGSVEQQLNYQSPIAPMDLGLYFSRYPYWIKFLQDVYHFSHTMIPDQEIIAARRRILQVVLSVLYYGKDLYQMAIQHVGSRDQLVTFLPDGATEADQARFNQVLVHFESQPEVSVERIRFIVPFFKMVKDRGLHVLWSRREFRHDGHPEIGFCIEDRAWINQFFDSAFLESAFSLAQMLTVYHPVGPYREWWGDLREARRSAHQRYKAAIQCFKAWNMPSIRAMYQSIRVVGLRGGLPALPSEILDFILYFMIPQKREGIVYVPDPRAGVIKPVVIQRTDIPELDRPSMGFSEFKKLQ